MQIEQKEKKLFIFANEIPFYLENPKESTQNIY